MDSIPPPHRGPAKLEAYRRELDPLIAEYFELNAIRQSHLMSRAIKV
jgi:hypothetical protein